MSIDYSLLRLVPGTDEYYEFCYQVKKSAESEYITEIFGWDETVQREFFNREWQEIRQDVILYRNKPIGTISVSEDNKETIIRLFFILPEHQNRGIGSYLLDNILSKADETGRVVKLKFLKNNPVKSLYLRHGFEIVSEDEYHFHVERRPVKFDENREE
ncbi:MAG: GNAT family N-acetyltransferase [Dehalococcoidales bacterium]|nr:MAG: GNAT family N-acetyltransferase [Dehalococcoidales bacterium]